jgi:hypothetical protein
MISISFARSGALRFDVQKDDGHFALEDVRDL